MVFDYRSFRNAVVNDYDRRRGNLVFDDAALRASASTLETKAFGHPLYERLGVGAKESAPLAVIFLDLTNFTRRSFWDDPFDVADLAHAILSGFVRTVGAFGGHPLGLRGDGLFAAFGPGDPTVVCSLALGACAFALKGVESEVNPWLDARSMERVQARAGADYGQIVFVRSGNEDGSEVNPIGFAANFAAKCEKEADSWQVVAGQGAADELGDATLCTQRPGSPKRYERNGERASYRYYDYHWRRTLPALPGVLQQVGGKSASTIQLS